MPERSDRHAGRDGSVSGDSPRSVPGLLRSRDAWRPNAELSQAGGRFLEFVAHNPECLEPVSFAALEGEAELAPYPLQPWPTFVSAAKAAAAAETNARLCSLVKSLPERVFDNDPARLARYFRLDPRYAKLVTLLLRRDDYVTGLVVRGDYLNTSDGMRCLELNFGGNLGGWMVPSIVGRYRDVPLLERFARESAVSWTYRDVPRLFFAHIIERARRAGRLRDGELRIAFVVPPEWRSGVVSLEYTPVPSMPCWRSAPRRSEARWWFATPRS
jgi:hypothetical protein